MFRKLLLVSLGTALLAACEAPQNAGGPAPAATESVPDEQVGTSPYTNCSFDTAPSGETFDTIILNGRVMDPECNFDGVRNVGIKDGRIVLITAGEISGARNIDATGHAVVSGFINTHSHSFAPFEQRLMAHDGTTTVLDIEFGVGNAPLFYDKYEGDSLLNFGSGIGHEQIRKIVLDGLTAEETSDPTYASQSRAIAQQDGRAQWALDVPTPEQHKQILQLFEQGMRDGAIAVDSTVGYMGYGVPTYELFDLQKIAKKYDRIFGAHTRFGPTESLPTDYSIGVREVLANAVALDGALILSHMQNSGWNETYELCRRMQEKGMVIFCEYYPSIYGNPNIATPQLLPDKIKLNNMDPTTTIVNPVTGENFASDEEFFRMQEEDPGQNVFVLVRDPEWIEQWVHMKDTALANDVMTYVTPEGKLLPEDADPSEYGGHPRNARTYSYVFRMAREQGVPLMDIVHNASYTPAKYLSRLGLKAMQERGRLQPGMVADIVILDPENFSDSATMKQGERGRFSKGIPYVMVNGTLVVDNGESQLGNRPGQPIRYPLITDGEIDLDLGDKRYQWHADFPDSQLN